jgi:hypothetical protein
MAALSPLKMGKIFPFFGTMTYNYVNFITASPVQLKAQYQKII